MENNLQIAEYNCMRRPTPEEIEVARQRVVDPNILFGDEKLYFIFKMLGMDVEYEDIVND